MTSVLSSMIRGNCNIINDIGLDDVFALMYYPNVFRREKFNPEQKPNIMKLRRQICYVITPSATEQHRYATCTQIDDANCPLDALRFKLKSLENRYMELS